MPLNNRGEWISHMCAGNNHHLCPHDFDDGGGKTAYCDCNCHRKKKAHVNVKLHYTTKTGELVTPPHYPEEVDLAGFTSSSEVNDEVICEAILTHLKAHGGEILDICVYWTALDASVPRNCRPH